MPHDAKGRLIEVGDVIKTIPSNPGCDPVCENREYIGTVVDIHSAEQSCTGQFAFMVPSKNDSADFGMDLKVDYFSAGEAIIVLHHDGTLPQ